MATSEALLISAVLQAKDYRPVTNHGVNQEMFSIHPDEFRYITNHYTKHGKVPSKTLFKSKFPDFTVYKVDEVDSICEEVKQDYARGAMTLLLDRSIDFLMQGRIDTALDSLGTDLLRVQAIVQDVQDDYDVATDWEKTYEDAMRRIERVRNNGTAGVPTGFGTLDLATGGLQPGWVNIVGARLGHGKTWTMTHMATTAAVSGYSAMYWSLEQSRHQIAMRAHTSLSRLLWHDTFRNRDLMRGTGFDLQGYKDFLSQLDDMMLGRLVINDTARGGIGPMEVAAAIERETPDIVFVDYITLMKQKGDGGWLSTADLSRAVQQVAQRYQVPIVLAAQNNRTAIGDDEPDPGALGRSDAIGQDADLVLMVTKKSVSVRKMKIAKFRHGEDGQHWFVKWKVNSGEIQEVSGNDADLLIQADQEVD